MATAEELTTAAPWREGADNAGVLVWVFIAAYLIALLCLAAGGWWTSKQQGLQTTDEQLEDHYIAGRSFKTFVLAMTVFSTVYSGYTVVGLPQEVYTTGFGGYRWIMTITVMVWTIALFGGRIQWLSVVRKYVSPTHFIKDRYNSHVFTFLVSGGMAFPALTYVLAQFKSMGSTIEGLSNGDIKAFPAATVFCVIMIIYETFGGLRAIAWTDSLQGCVLVVGFLLFYIAQEELFGGVEEAGNYIRTIGNNGNMLKEEQVQTYFGFGASLFFSYCFYPQMIQRYCGAQSAKTFKLAMIFLVFGSWLAVTCSLCTGTVALYYFKHGNPNVTSTGAFGAIMRVTMNQGAGWNFIGSAMVTASLAAFMSTADSAINGFSACLTMDWFKPYPWIWKFWAEEKKWQGSEILYVGKFLSISCAVTALLLSETDMELSPLLTLQGSVLCQVFPAFFFGLFFDKFHVTSATVGYFVGFLISLIEQCAGADQCIQKGADWYWNGLHPGLSAMGINGAIFVIGSIIEEQYGDVQPSWDKLLSQDHEFPKHLIGFTLEGEGTRPWHWPNMLLPIAALILACFNIPWYRSDDYGEPEDFVGGLPVYVRDGFIFSGVNAIFYLIACLSMWEGGEPVQMKGLPWDNEGETSEEVVQVVNNNEYKRGAETEKKLEMTKEIKPITETAGAEWTPSNLGEGLE